MKKFISASLLATTFLGLGASTAYAADTNLTITNESEWEMHIPMSQTLNQASSTIGDLYISGSIEPLKEIAVEATHDGVFTRVDHTDTLAFSLLENATNFTNTTINEAAVTGEEKHPLTISIEPADFNTAKAGTYQATLVFTATLQNTTTK